MADQYILVDATRSSVNKIHPNKHLGNNYSVLSATEEIIYGDLSFIGGDSPVIPYQIPKDEEGLLDTFAFPWPQCCLCQKDMIFVAQVDTSENLSDRRLLTLFSCASCDVDDPSSWTALRIYSIANRDDMKDGKGPQALFATEEVTEEATTVIKETVDIASSLDAMLASLDAQINAVPSIHAVQGDQAATQNVLPGDVVGLVPQCKSGMRCKKSYWVGYERGGATEVVEEDLDVVAETSRQDPKQTDLVLSDEDDDVGAEILACDNDVLSRWNELQYRFNSGIVGFYSNSSQPLLTGLEAKTITQSTFEDVQCSRCRKACKLECQFLPPVFGTIGHPSLNMPVVNIFTCSADCIPSGRLQSEGLVVVSEPVSVLSTAAPENGSSPRRELGDISDVEENSSP